MEFSVRDWMVIVGVLLVLAVVLDGYRRMRNERRNNLRMSLSGRREPGADDSAINPELPGGGARVITGRAVKPPQPRSPVAGQRSSVPVLLEPAESDPPEQAEGDPGNASNGWQEPYDPELGSVVPDRGDEVLSRPQAGSGGAPGSGAASGPAAFAGDDPPETLEDSEDPLFSPVSSRELTGADHGTPDPEAIDEVLVINVLARGGEYAGPDMLQILLSCDLRHGRMNIFHRHEQPGGKGAVQFSVANLVEPGTFDLDGIAGFSTPGLCFFMTLPGPKAPLRAFDYMVETAQCLVRNLGGELRDEAHSVMTPQTLEHCRERIREFERRQLTQNI